MIYSDNTKTKIQKEIKQAWYDSNFKGIVILPTGAGKTFAGFMAVEDFTNETKLVVVPSEYIKNQWLGLIKENNLPNFEVVIINTLIKNSYDVDILILDEVHRYAATKFSEVFNKVKYKKILAFTATLERTDQKHYIIENYAPVVYKKTIKDALELNLIPEFINYNLKVSISPDSEKRYSRLNDKFNNFFAFFGFDFTLAMNCLQYDNHRQLYSNSTGYDPQEIRIKAINFSRAMRERKDFIYYHPDKNKSVVDIVNKFSDKKIIVFAERKKILEELKKLIPNSQIYDPVKSNKVLTKIMDDYKNNNFKVLLTAKALDEGMDVPDIDIGIIHSGNSSKINGKQRIGRVLRKDKLKIPIIVSIYLENTQDEKWLIKRNEGVPNTYWIENINDINYEPSEELLKEEDRHDYFTKRVKLF